MLHQNTWAQWQTWGCKGCKCTRHWAGGAATSVAPRLHPPSRSVKPLREATSAATSTHGKHFLEWFCMAIKRHLPLVESYFPKSHNTATKHRLPLLRGWAALCSHVRLLRGRGGTCQWRCAPGCQRPPRVTPAWAYTSTLHTESEVITFTAPSRNGYDAVMKP